MLAGLKPEVAHGFLVCEQTTFLRRTARPANATEPDLPMISLER